VLLSNEGMGEGSLKGLRKNVCKRKCRWKLLSDDVRESMIFFEVAE
jgi:hypothetical protein